MNETFDKTGYVKVEKFIDEKTTQIVSLYLENKIKRGEWVPKNKEELREGDFSKLHYYADPLLEVILKEYLPLVEEQTGLELQPTYSYARVYQEGEELNAHIDRPSCQISVTVNVAYIGENWPIWMQHENNDPAKFLLTPGDAVIYKGCEVMHWRRELPEGQLYVQFMLHYVDKNGPYAGYKFDERESLGLMSSRE